MLSFGPHRLVHSRRKAGQDGGMGSLPQRPLLCPSTAMAQTLSSRPRWRCKLSIRPAPFGHARPLPPFASAAQWLGAQSRLDGGKGRGRGPSVPAARPLPPAGPVGYPGHPESRPLLLSPAQSTAMVQTLSSHRRWRRELSVPPDQSATPATRVPPPPCLLSNRGHSEGTVKKTGLVVVRNMKIVDLHCSSEELHAGKIALIKHGSRLKNCDLYFSRKPCSACLKMIVNETWQHGPGTHKATLASPKGDTGSATTPKRQPTKLQPVLPGTPWRKMRPIAQPNRNSGYGSRQKRQTGRSLQGRRQTLAGVCNEDESGRLWLEPAAKTKKAWVPAGVNRISYWPADPEISLLSEASTSEDAKLDAKAVERLKSNSRAHVCVLLQPLVCCMMQFVEETSYKCDFIQKMAKTFPDTNIDFYSKCRQERIKEYEMLFFVSNEELHKQMLMTIGLENLCENPYFSNLRQNMKDLILLLATVASSVPSCKHYGFYCDKTEQSNEIHNQSLPQEIARHCMVQARLLAYRTGSRWGEERSNCLQLWAGLCLGCGKECQPAGGRD
ncbi:hypothetical protein QTO34_016892 [Cnephaeus nilssonii]|uniref:Cytidine and dCMP deaminase domain containing 1 n=1 Tax=Cnephaeus nilssonii TaxID=3371016 RepID=A0AA40LQQ8_CNENI|nr:hypothetical protein QTO34_016892 [Eptesicus nilssonii]